MAYKDMAAASSAGWDDAVLVPDANALVLYGEEEKQQARDLVCRAMLYGESEQLWHNALADFQLRRKDFIDRGLWEVISAEFRRRRDLQLGGSATAVSQGAMTDGSKRARPSSPAGPPPPTAANQPPLVVTEGPRLPSKATSARSNVKGPPAPAGPPPPAPSMLDGIVVSQAELPEEVTSLLHWSRTPINFGKYKLNNWTYMHLASCGGSQEFSYKLWVMARISSGGDQLRDLARFLDIVRKANVLPAKACSPTSSSSSVPVRRAPTIDKETAPRADSPSSQLSSERTFGGPMPSP